VVKTVDEGASLPLHGTASDSDCNILTVLWDVDAGQLSDPSSLDPVYTAPMLPGCDDADVLVTLTAVDTCGASACDSFVLRIRNVNHAPTIDAGEDLWIDEGTAVLMQAVAQDVDGDTLSILWSAGGGVGAFDNAGATKATFLAPMIDTCGGVDIPLQITVTDPCGATACDSIVVHVRNVNKGPAAELGPDFAIDEGTTIRLTPVISDPECDALTYCWTTTAGVLTEANGPTPTLCAPKTDKCDGEALVVTLTVTDPCGLTATDSVRIHVRNVNAAPTVDLGADLCIVEGSTLQLKPRVSDPDGDVLKYVWTVSAGRLDNFCAQAPVYVAPMTSSCDGANVAVTLTVTDPCGLTATDSLIIRIENVNLPPAVVADP
jgi:predicted secreted protein